MPRRYLQRTNDRRLAPDYAGDVLVWDIDKTYLATRFSSWRGLMSIPFEMAVDKETIPGAVPLLRALRHGAGAESAIVPLFFVSGSPVQLRGVVERRMTLDGVDYDGVTFKDQLGLLMAGHPRRITEQVGYKLTALLLYRAEVPAGARWLLFGDDVEADATVFALFGEVCAGLRGTGLAERLEALGVHRVRRHREARRQVHGVGHRVPVHRDAVADAVDLAAGLPVTADPVARIFIHLERGTDPESFTDPRVVPTHTYLQTALVLAHLGRVRDQAILAVAKDLRARGLPEARIEAWIDDAGTRLQVPASLCRLARR